MNGIVWKIRSGAPRRDLPAHYGSWKSINTRFHRWALNGLSTRMLAGAQVTRTPPGTSTGWAGLCRRRARRGRPSEARLRAYGSRHGRYRAKYAFRPMD